MTKFYKISSFIFQVTAFLFIIARVLIMVSESHELFNMDQILECVKNHAFAIPMDIQVVRITGEIFSIFYCSSRMILFYLGIPEKNEVERTNEICSV